MGATMGKNGTLLDSLPSSQGTLHVVMLGLDSAGKTTALYRMKFDQYLNTVPTIGFNCEKVRGTTGRAKGVSFLIWDVGGQEKLRPLWRSYTRCTDGIIFVVDSVDVERMEEAKMELMRTAKCPDNQGTPVLILANKQDLPNAKEPKELEKLLGLYELSPIYPSSLSSQALSSSASNSSNSSSNKDNKDTSSISSGTNSSTSSQLQKSEQQQQQQSMVATKFQDYPPLKLWHIQPACAITGEGLQEGLEALYDMIVRKRKMHKNKKKR